MSKKKKKNCSNSLLHILQNLPKILQNEWCPTTLAIQPLKISKIQPEYISFSRCSKLRYFNMHIYTRSKQLARGREMQVEWSIMVIRNLSSVSGRKLPPLNSLGSQGTSQPLAPIILRYVLGLLVFFLTTQVIHWGKKELPIWWPNVHVAGRRRTQAERHRSGRTATAHILSSTHHLNTDSCSRGKWLDAFSSAHHRALFIFRK